jgi:hypothetical protein
VLGHHRFKHYVRSPLDDRCIHCRQPWNKLEPSTPSNLSTSASWIPCLTDPEPRMRVLRRDADSRANTTLPRPTPFCLRTRGRVSQGIRRGRSLGRSSCCRRADHRGRGNRGPSPADRRVLAVPFMRLIDDEPIRRHTSRCRGESIDTSNTRRLAATVYAESPGFLLPPLVDRGRDDARHPVASGPRHFGRGQQMLIGDCFTGVVEDERI